MVNVAVAIPLVVVEVSVIIGLAMEQLGVLVAVEGLDVVSEQVSVTVPE